MKPLELENFSELSERELEEVNGGLLSAAAITSLAALIPSMVAFAAKVVPPTIKAFVKAVDYVSGLIVDILKR
ncbi:MAG: class IIb bacteriocin, lactobin A/cerein 7B family [Clostridiales bacterium]|jgi:lactobin A/cerein 7B family class IIb bacteriocin|nr:class IIb bacteriocin, lactobin A/cerein 7B family [Clostridiales bacterium]